ncbi:MAG TPA: hypothetical protein VKP88_03345 [Candidatus Paceibacterota bacterium]|nr:hypothetical protein [Candidatus Paceibacterota bacterium]
MTSTITVRHIFVAILLTLVPLFVTYGQTDRTVGETDAAPSDAVTEVEAANYNNTRSNRSSVAAPEQLATTTGETNEATTTDRAQNHNSSRSNRSSGVAAPDTNVCDGVTCADGSCAATADECPLAADRVPAASVCPSGGGDCDDTDPAVRPDEATRDRDDGVFDLTAPPIIIDAPGADTSGVGSDDCDDADDCRRPDAVQAATSDSLDPDADGDGISDGSERAQNHNSSRSNRTSPVAVPDEIDSDDDGDGVPTANESAASADRAATLVWRDGRFERIDVPNELSANDTTNDWVHCWGKGEDAAGVVQSWGDGLCVTLPDAATTTVSLDRVPRVNLDGAAVRAWSERERQAWQTFTADRVNPTSFERLSAELIRASQADERIIGMEVAGGDDPEESVSLTYTPVIVRYQAPMNLFGFIPLEREVQAAIDTQGEVMIDYPWYRFLATTPATDTIQSLLQRTRDVLAAE